VIAFGVSLPLVGARIFRRPTGAHREAQLRVTK
jgi:hypothetical protein